jgi:NAD(P)-dependent dehydrogenase (short-subunit alcohol dehydrogenase family)
MTQSETSPRIALISGASRGIGLEVGRQLVSAGWCVAFGMRDVSSAEGLLGSYDRARWRAVTLDVRDDASCLEAVAKTIDAFGRIDTLINNAGIDYDTDQSVTAPDFDRSRAVMETNFWGAWQLALAAMPHVIASRGVIVNVSSGSGALDGMGAETPAYGISKAALNALTIKLAAALKPKGVRVNAVCPGWVATDMGGGGRPVADGAKGVVWAATLPPDGPSGGFFRDGRPISW